MAIESLEDEDWGAASARACQRIDKFAVAHNRMRSACIVHRRLSVPAFLGRCRGERSADQIEAKRRDGGGEQEDHRGSYSIC